MLYDLLVRPLLTRLARLDPKAGVSADVSFDGKLLRVLQDPRMYSMLRWQQFLEQCFMPRVFYDIGANDPFSITGQQQTYKPLMPDTRFFLFEAMAKHEPALKRAGEPYAVAVLGAEDGAKKTFYETKDYAEGLQDSYYRDRFPHYADGAAIATEHTIRRLDSIVEERGWPLPDFIKLDTQGSELDILKGAPRCLESARGLQIECSVRDCNEGAPLMADVLAFVQRAGFQLHDLVQLHYGPARELLQVDALFVRPDAVTATASPPS